jgi:glycosyltransferase involved in cell wall biosynthesis
MATIPRPESPDLAVVILTFNEALHLQRCIDSVAGMAQRIIVVDSLSSDRTVEIARAAGASVLTHAFVNHAAQLNWALEHAAIDTQWVMRLDADEVVTDRLRKVLRPALSRLPDAVAGVTLNRQIHFLGRWIRHGAIYPRRMLRVWRKGHGRSEERWMDEHIVVDGTIVHLDADLADINLNNITWWVSKHNHYATREAIDQLQQRTQRGVADAAISRQARVTRWLKRHVYGSLPMPVRSLAYFVYRYVVRLGFLDGWPGLVFHALQGLWYRFLVDVKVRELEWLMHQRGQSLAEVVKAEFGYELPEDGRGGTVG